MAPYTGHGLVQRQQLEHLLLEVHLGLIDLLVQLLHQARRVGVAIGARRVGQIEQFAGVGTDLGYDQVPQQ